MFIIGMLMSLTLTGCGNNGNGNIVYLPEDPTVTPAPTATPPAETVTLTEIQLSPAVKSIAIGINIQYRAIGIYSNGTHSDLTETATWESSDTAIATVNGSGLVNTLTAGSTIITASSKRVSSNNATLMVSSATVTSIQVTPAKISVPVETTGTYTAIAYFSDNSSHDITKQATWTAEVTSIVNIVTSGDNAGHAKALKVGTTNITASIASITSNAAIITVTDATLTSIHIDPIRKTVPTGVHGQYSATGIYSDETTIDLTPFVTWSSSDTNVATIDNTGLAQTLSAGTSKITAAFGEKTGIATLTVTNVTVKSVSITPADTTVISGKTGTYTAIATFTDETEHDVTRQATWISAGPSTVYVVTSGDNAGDAHALKGGRTTITATYSSVTSNTATIEVTSPTLESLEIIGLTAANVNDAIKLTALATYSDGTDLDVTSEVLWDAFDENLIKSDIIFVDNKGVVTAKEEGYAEISARFSDVNDENMIARHPVRFVETSAAVKSLDIHDGDSSCAKDTIITGTTVDIPLLDDVTQPDNSVDPSIPVTPGAYYAVACATFEDGSVEYVGNVSGWWSSDQESAYINGLQSPYVFGRNYAQGVTIKAQYAGMEASFKVNVTDAITRTLVSIDIVPRETENVVGSTLNIPEGLYSWVTAYGNYSDGSREDINSNVFWKSSELSVAYMNETQGSNIYGRGAGDATISAYWQGVTGTIDVHVIKLDSITLKAGEDSTHPVSGTVINTTGSTLYISSQSIGGTYPKQVYLEAYGEYEDDVTRYINTDVIWRVDDSSKASMIAPNGSWIKGKETGTTTVSAKLSNVEGFATVDVE